MQPGLALCISFTPAAPAALMESTHMSFKAALLAAAALTGPTLVNLALTNPALAQAAAPLPASLPTPAESSNTLGRATPDMRRVLVKLLALGAKPLGSLSVAETRAGPSPADAVKAVLKDQGKDPAALAAASGVTKKDMTYPGAAGPQAIRIYTPTHTSGALPLIVYIHGGGWVIADLDTYDSSPIALARKTGAIVASVEYRHAPENRFPAAHEDTFAAYKWALANAASFGADPARVAIAGESVGGNMAINVAIRARDEHVQAPRRMLLVYPVAGTDLSTPSYQKNEHAIPLSKPAMEWFIKNTIQSPADLKDPRLDVVGQANLKGLPPATIINAEIDPLASDGDRLAAKLKAAGVQVTHKQYPGVTHEFFGMDAAVKEAAEAQDLAAKDLRAALLK